MRGKTPEDRTLLDLLDPVAQAHGYEIVRLRLMGGSAPGRSRARTLQIMAEGGDGDMQIDDCVTLSRAVSEVMDVADPVDGEYRLEVSSAGIDRPLTRLKDFDAYAGYEARLELDRMAEGRKRFKGVLAGVDGDLVDIDQEGEAQTTQIPFAWIVEAKLTLSDAIMQRGAEQRAARLAAQADEPAVEDGDTEHLEESP